MTFFALAYSSYILWSWPLGKVWHHHTYKALSQKLSALPYIFCFLRKGIIESALLCVCWIAPQSDHVFKCSIQVLGTTLCKKRFGYLQEVVFMENFWNFKVIPNTKNHFEVGLSKLVLKIILVIPMGRFESLVLLFLVEVWSDVLLVKIV